MQEASVDKEWEKLEKIADMASDESSSKNKSSSNWQIKQPRTVHSATLMDLSRPKNSELEQKFEDRVVL